METPPQSSSDAEEDYQSASSSASSSTIPPSHIALHLALSSIFLLRSRQRQQQLHRSLPLASGLPPLSAPQKLKLPSPFALLKKTVDSDGTPVTFSNSHEKSVSWRLEGMQESSSAENLMQYIPSHSLRRRSRSASFSSSRHDEIRNEIAFDAISPFDGNTLPRHSRESRAIAEFPGESNKKLWNSDFISSQDELSDESSVSSLSSEKKNLSFNGRLKRRYPSFGHDDSGPHNELIEEDEVFAKDIIGDDGFGMKTGVDGGLNLLAKELEEDATEYRMSTDDMSSSPLLWPFGLAIKTIGFQIRLIIQMFSLIGMIFNWCNSFASSRIKETLQVKDRAKEALNQKVSMITRVPPKVAENGSILLKKTAWGCLAATYVCFLLSMLLFPALVLDFLFLNRIVEEPVSIKEPLHFDYTLDNPTAFVSFHPTHRSELSMVEAVQHKEHVRAIPASHKVHITVIMTLPESDYNRNLGMFQLTAELLSESGQSIKVSSRPCMLRFHSEPIRWLKTIVLGLPSLVGILSESQKLIIHLMEFEEQYVPVTAVKILLQPKAGMPLGQGIPEVYTANVHIESQLPWLKNLLRSWKWTFYIWMGLMLYIVEVIMVLCCCRRALVPKSWVGRAAIPNIDTKENGKTSADGNGDGSAGKPVISRRHQNRQHYLNDEIPIARVKQV